MAQKISFEFDEWTALAEAAVETGRRDKNPHLLLLAARIEREQGLPASASSTETEAQRLIDQLDAAMGDQEKAEYATAVEAIRERGRKGESASTSFLQRTLQVGYNRAARLIERMESEGIITKPDRNGVRTVL